ncbi:MULTISPECIES: HlyD family efflux transporter periplasmic adaptor subunit [unclassified Sphingopyxis]|jgi:membrane fusion protein (multidrug efflux system)|uniref:HlyD family secretion protein n=1 Tax=unclassified Sphingopyxis TaxID=2614943 RepID=UPI0006C0E89A|nr:MULTISPECIES: HlyD family efflux transporter periplasmic adaptor subunit [unclassified Sphingopyxis]USI76444.1 HlyD family efflux transporter periplasmic adaptor subunit [Sphingopyxis sp. USTB-05]GAO76824.1 membrane fusion component of tripartite multidrug resistance system [Sphingopyxis sp. C-1]
MMADETAAAATPAPETSSDASSEGNGAKRTKLLRILAIVVVTIGVMWGLWYFLTQAGRVHTDNAYVGADSAQVTALIAGPVKEVRVSGTQAVKKGDILVILDDADQRIAVVDAEAALRLARQRYGQADANADAARARVAARGADIAQARARLRDANATVERARAELARRESIAGTGAVSGEELTSARAALASASAARDLAAAGIASAEATRGSASGDLGAAEAVVRGTTINTAPDVAAAEARLEKAKLDLARTVLRAPVDGIVTNRQVQVGQRIAAGAPIMVIVPISTAYVDANFKESQFGDIRIGQPVELTSDYYGDDVVYRGKVIGIAGGTGAAFSLIPAQNATGNWVKVVQRLPVRIALDPKELKAHPLRVGLSMEATIDTRGN